MRTPAGFLLDSPMKNKSFTKLPTSIEEQIHLLRSRDLIINNEAQANHYLTYISYYRFCGYGIEFKDISPGSGDNYRQGTTFEDILNCYVFDRKLRLLVIDAIE